MLVTTLEHVFHAMALSFPQVSEWLGAPHVAAWWREPHDLAAIEVKYGPRVDGAEPTRVFVVEADGEPVGLIQRYRIRDYPDWERAVRVALCRRMRWELIT